MLNRYRKILIRLFERVHELQADPFGRRLLALDIQEELLARIGNAERRIRTIRLENAKIKQNISQSRSTREVSSRLKAIHQQKMDHIEVQKKLVVTLRSIGDSVAFIYGDRHELKQLAQGGDPGFITGKSGTRLERSILRAAFKMGATVVMNDLTYNLRRGDLTMFRPDLWPNGDSPIMLIEAKSGQGGNKKRAERQLEVMKEISDYIRTDSRIVGETHQFRVEVTETTRHHFESITRLIKNLPSDGWAYVEIEPGLHYVAIGTNVIDGTIQAVFERLSHMQEQWIIINANDLKGAALGYYPFPLCIRDAECLFRFYNGQFIVLVLVGTNFINQAIASEGIAVQPTEDVWKLVSLEHDDNWGERYVTPRAIGMLAGEFLSLRWFIDNVLLGNLREAMTRMLKEQTAKSN